MMRNTKKPSSPLSRQIVNFVIHLRWHYQVFILSGGFLAGGLLSSHINWSEFALQFLNVHLLLFGGATAYNSFWDKDEGPVGGLSKPPRMQHWMQPASLLLQALGLILGLRAGMIFTFIYLTSILLFWLYSAPGVRWKGKPLASLIAIGISTGTNSLLMGYLAAGNVAIPIEVWVASAGVACIILSMYPASQIYQLEEDRQRGDETFAIRFGFVGVMRFYRFAYAAGLLLLGWALTQEGVWSGVVFVLVGAATGVWVDRRLRSMDTADDHYANVMRIKYFTSLAFVSFIMVLLLLDI